MCNSICVTQEIIGVENNTITVPGQTSEDLSLTLELAKRIRHKNKEDSNKKKKKDFVL